MDVGGSAESISGLLAVFGRFGVEGADAEKTLSLFSRGLRGDISASEASTQNAKSFSGTLAELGVESTDAQGHLRPMGEALLDVADGFKAHASDGQNAARAMALFGRSGRDLLPVLVLGRDGITELAGEAAKLGLTLTQANVNSVHQFVMEQKNMGEAIEGLKVQIGVGLMPLFTELAKVGSQWAKSLNGEGGKAIKTFTTDIDLLVAKFQELDKGWKDSPLNPGNASKVPGAEDRRNFFQGLPDKIGKLLPSQDLIDAAANSQTGVGQVPAADLAAQQAAAAAQQAARQGTSAHDRKEDLEIARDAASAQADAAARQNAGLNAEETTKKQIETLDKQIADAERQSAIIQHDITLKTRESLDLKRSEAEIQLELLPLKAQQADLERQLLIATDKRAGLERDAAVTRAQMAANASADALEGATFEERRLRLKVQADALGGRGVAAADIAALTKLALNKPQLELNALTGERPATLAERERQRAQQAQDLATLPIRERQADLERSMSDLNAASAAVQQQIEAARLHGVVDTTDLQKQKQAIDDRIFDTQQRKADLEGKGLVLNITQNITATGEVDYDKIIQNTYSAVFDGLKQAQTNLSLPSPSFAPGSRTPGVTGPF